MRKEDLPFNCLVESQQLFFFERIHTVCVGYILQIPIPHCRVEVVVYDRLVSEDAGNIVKKTDNMQDVVFYKEMYPMFIKAGMGNLTPSKIDEYVLKLYGLKSMKPSKVGADGKKVQDRGFKGLILCDVGFDEAADRIRRNESVRQSVRVRTEDNFTPDTRIGTK